MKKAFKIILITFLLIFSVYFWGIPAIYNFNQDKIISSINKETGLNLDVQNSKIKMGILPSIQFQSDTFILNKDFVIKNPKIKIELTPLILKKLSIKSFTADEINAKINLDKNKNLYLGDYLIKNLDTSFKTEIKDLNIKNYKINFNDEFNSQKLLLDGKQILIQNNSFLTNGKLFINDNLADVNISLTIPDKKDFNNIAIDGSITNLSLSEIAPYVKQISKNQIENLSGVVNLQAKYISNKNLIALNTENFSIKIKDIEKPIYLKTRTNINSEFEILNNNLEIENLLFKTNGINASIQGLIGNINTKQPNYNINLKIKDSKSEAFLPLMPYITLSNFDIDFKKLKEYGIYSTVNGEINIKGSDLEPSVNGSFIAEDVYVQKPLNIPKATLKLDFKDKLLYFDAFVPASKEEHVKVKGNVELYGEKLSNIDITSTSSVDLKTAQLILNPLHEILTFEIGPVPIMDIKGVGNIKLKVKGNKENPHLWGRFNFKNATVKFDNINAVIKNGSGRLDFKDENMNFTTYHANLNGAPIKVEGNCTTQGKLKFNVISNKQSLNEALKILNTSPMLNSFNKLSKNISAGAGKVNILVTLEGNLKHLKDFKLGKTIIPSGHIKLINNSVLLNKPNFLIKNITGDINFKNTDTDFNISTLLDEQKINFTGKIKDNKIYSNNKFYNLNLKIMNSDISIDSGEFNINGDKITIKKLNTKLDSKPILIDGDISNIYEKPKLDLYITSKAAQTFIDKYINKFSIYPLIIKGDINYSGRFSGTLDKLNILGTVNLDKGSSIYYKGAIIEAKDFPIKLNLDLTLFEKTMSIKNFQYSELDTKNKPHSVLTASGKLKLKNNSIFFNNFKVITQKNADARIFNIIFKKPIIKEGMFTSNFIVNGDINSPSMFGTFNLFGINAPFFDSVIQDINIVFKNKTSKINMKGDILSNKIILDANINNSLEAPYVINSADLYLGNFNVNSFLRHLDKIIIEDVDKTSDTSELDKFNIRDLIIKNLNIKANSVYVRNLFATDVDAKISVINGLLSLKKLNFITAEGTISGKLKYNFINSDMDLWLDFDNINANTISDALFDIKNQMYGDLSGETQLSCNGKSHNDCMKTLNGECKFRVSNGKMPKLGSLEYLLKSSNVLKSGITGLTLNNIIQILIPPINSGEFESIKGHFIIKDGITDNINIASKGKDLSIFISGGYNFSNYDTNFEIIGRLSKKVKNALGAIGNVSINSLLNKLPGLNLSKANKAEIVQIINKLPGIELDTNDYRIFFVKMDGNIDSEDFNIIFKWLD